MKTALQFGVIFGMPLEAEVEVKEGAIVSLTNIFDAKEKNATLWEGEEFDPLHDDQGVSAAEFESALKKNKALKIMLVKKVIERVAVAKPCTMSGVYGERVVRPRIKVFFDVKKLNEAVQGKLIVIGEAGSFLAVKEGKGGNEVRNDILDVLHRTLEILREREEKDVLELKELSNHTVHDASIYQDIDSVEIAVVVYSLYKLLDRRMSISSEMYKRIFDEFHDCLHALNDNKLHEYNDSIQQLFVLIKKIDDSVPQYVQEIINKARITKGSKLFEHGLTAKRAAYIMGITEWELLGYIGKTQIVDSFKPGGVSAKRRLAIALELFR